MPFKVDCFVEPEGDVADVLLQVRYDDKFDRVPVDIVCVIDTSGSMSASAMPPGLERDAEQHDALSVVLHSCKTVASLLGPEDRICVVKYSSNPVVAVPFTHVTTEALPGILKALDYTTPSGGTDIWGGLERALNLLRQEPEATASATAQLPRQAHVLLLSDGDPSTSPPIGEAAKLYETLHTMDFSIIPRVHAYAFGYGCEPKLMGDIAAAGGGLYAFIADASLVGSVFVNTLSNLLTTFSTNCSVFLDLKGKLRVEGAKAEVVGDPAAEAAAALAIADAADAGREPPADAVATLAGADAASASSWQAGAPLTTRPPVSAVKVGPHGLQVDVGDLRLGQTRHVLLRLSGVTDVAGSGAPGTAAGSAVVVSKASSGPPMRVTVPLTFGKATSGACGSIDGSDAPSAAAAATPSASVDKLRETLAVQRVRREVVGVLSEVMAANRNTKISAAGAAEADAKVEAACAVVERLSATVAAAAAAAATPDAAVPPGGADAPHPDAADAGPVRPRRGVVADAAPAAAVAADAPAAGAAATLSVDDVRRFGELDRDVTAAESVKGMAYDLSGETRYALVPASWTKWGCRYLPALLNAHQLEVASNFKDPGIQSYATAPFRALRTVGQKMFLDIPCMPVRRSAPAHYGGGGGGGGGPAGGGAHRAAAVASATISRTYYDISGGCVDASAMLLCVRGANAEAGGSAGAPTRVPASSVCVGDVLYTTTGVAAGAVVGILVTLVGRQVNMCRVGDLLITPWHPIHTAPDVSADASPAEAGAPWAFPNTLSPPAVVAVDAVYSFAVQSPDGSYAPMFAAGGVDVIALAHGITDDAVAQHDFFGTQAVVDAILRVGEGGVATVREFQFERGPDGRHCGLLALGSAVGPSSHVVGDVAPACGKFASAGVVAA